MGVSELQFPGSQRKADSEKACGQRPGWSGSCLTAGTEAGPVLITHMGFVMATRALSISVGEPPFKRNLKRKLKISS